MSPLLHPDAPVPVLILTDEDYRRAFAPEPPAPPRRKIGRAVVGAVVLLVASTAAVLAWRWSRPRPNPAPTVVARATEPVVEPVVAPPPPPRIPPAPPPAREVEEEEIPAAPSPPAIRPPAAPWNGGHAWVRIALRLEHRSQVREVERRVTVAWERDRFVVERSASTSEDLWLDRLELLFQLTSPDDSWRRQVTREGSEIVRAGTVELACRAVEGEDRFPEGVRKFRYWYSDDFPAGAVRAEQTLGDITLACRVMEFGPAPAQKP